MTDWEYIQGMQAGQPAALEALVHRYSGYVAAVVARVIATATAQDREEVASDVFVALWKNAARLEPCESIKPWLATVARNTALKHYRRKRGEQDVPLEDNTLLLEDTAATGRLEAAEEAEQVRMALQSLSAGDRQLFLRHYYWHQTIGQIARDTGMNQSTIKSRLHRGRKVLKTQLEQEGCSA